MRDITFRPTIAIALLLLALSVTIPLLAQSHHVLVMADAVKWAPAPPLPPGAEIAVLEGDPHAKGSVTLRLKFPANYDIPAHWHSMTERVTVLSGALNVGMGDKLDRKASQRLDPGGFVSLPGKMNHFAWTTTPTIVQIHLEGPFDIFYVNPADDPLQRQSTR
jgi:anti-sigma factor ChrR (cupin superfamily)